MFGSPIYDITSVTVLGNHGLHLVFADGSEGDVDIARLIDFRGVFEALPDVREFQRVYVDPEAGTIVWPNGADLDPRLTTKKPAASTARCGWPSHS